MSKRSIIEINENLCNGCGVCIPNCPEGALQIIDGKARMISDLFCDGLGACVGKCPQNAMNIIEREAEPYNEKKAMENVIKGGENVIKAHLIHLKNHNEIKYLKEALEFLNENQINNPLPDILSNNTDCNNLGGCPGSKTISLKGNNDNNYIYTGERKSHLTQWPIQLHLISPSASYFTNSDLLIAADCTAFSIGDFHKRFLKGKSIIIACPKLDSNQDIYIDKIKSLINVSKVNTITVLIMEVPCCSGLVAIINKAVQSVDRKVPVKRIVVSLKGEVLSEEWI